MRFEGKSIWVTGASSGIGKALAIYLAGQGARLIISARSQDKLKAIASLNPEADIRVLPFDLAEPDAVDDAAEKALEIFPQIDILINNAGISPKILFHELTSEKIERIYRVDLISPVHLARAVVGRMMENGTGHLVFVSSLAAYVSIPLRTIYSSTKAALHGLCDALRIELLPYKIPVTIIVPGFVDTNIGTDSVLNHDLQAGKQEDRLANGMSPERCARLICRAIKARRRQYFVAMGFKGWFALVVKKVAPRLLDRIISRFPQG